MTRDDLIAKLQQLINLSEGDPEIAHIEADDALLEYINDTEITATFHDITRWYA